MQPLGRSVETIDFGGARKEREQCSIIGVVSRACVYMCVCVCVCVCLFVVGVYVYVCTQAQLTIVPFCCHSLLNKAFRTPASIRTPHTGISTHEHMYTHTHTQMTRNTKPSLIQFNVEVHVNTLHATSVETFHIMP